MKFILFNINDTNKNRINKIKLDNKHYINEVSLSKRKLEEMMKTRPGVVQKLKNKYLDKNIEKIILKALEGYNKKWHYILSKNIMDIKYIPSKAEQLLGYQITCTNELDANIFKYIDEYLKNNNALKKHELKILLVANYNKNLNLDNINNLIKEYKSVNIYLKDKPSAYTLKRIKQINKSEGTTIEVLKKERKQFAEYNVVYFVDDKKGSFPRFRLNKNSLVIDASLAEEDKFNSNNIFMDKYVAKEDSITENLELLLGKYNKLQLASAIRKITNALDK